MWTWHWQAECSRPAPQRWGTHDRRLYCVSTAAQAVPPSTLIAVVVWSQRWTLGWVRQTGMTAPNRSDIGKPAPPVDMLCAPESVASEAHGATVWCGRTSALRTPTLLLRWVRTAVCPWGYPEDRPVSRYRNPVASRPLMRPATAEQASKSTVECCGSDAVRRNSLMLFSKRATSLTYQNQYICQGHVLCWPMRLRLIRPWAAPMESDAADEPTSTIALRSLPCSAATGSTASTARRL